MSDTKKDYYGKDVAEAISNACKDLGAPQENLDIEVVETGSTGIFGLIRKKTHIRAAVKEVEAEEEMAQATVKIETPTQTKKKPKKEDSVPAPKPSKDKVSQRKYGKKESQTVVTDPADADTGGMSTKNDKPQPPSQVKPEVQKPLSEESIELIGDELKEILNLIGYPSEVEVTAEGSAVTCKIKTDNEEILIGPDGKNLDSMQYLLRKMIARKITDRLRLSVDIGDYREKRKEGLKEKAVELAIQVKEDGKTQVIPALSPSERRVVHMTLQDDNEIRSRSVGDGLFKKILIYKPGKGKKGGGRKPYQPRGRKGNGPRKKKDS